MLMAGELDALVPFAETEDFYARLPSTLDRYLLIVPHAGHEFIDQCFDGALTVGGCTGAIPQDQLVAIEQTIGAAFLNRYVAGSSAASLEAAQTADYTLLVTPAGVSAAAVPTAAPIAAEPTPSAGAGTLLFSDLSRLSTTSTDPSRYAVAYSSGTYDISVKRPFDQGETVIPGMYADSTLSVDAALVQPADDQYLQLACRSDGPTRQYRFGIRPGTGEVWINRWVGASGVLPYATLFDEVSTAVHAGATPNHLELACKGTSIQGSVNGITMVTISDNSLQSGQSWIAVGEVRDGGHPDVPAEAHFQNLVVRQD
jgi:hypothetical protein